MGKTAGGTPLPGAGGPLAGDCRGIVPPPNVWAKRLSVNHTISGESVVWLAVDRSATKIRGAVAAAAGRAHGAGRASRVHRRPVRGNAGDGGIGRGGA